MTDDAHTLAPHAVETEEATLTAQDHVVRIERAGGGRVLEFAAKDIRRIQIDLEEGQPAIVAIVPHSTGPEMFRVPREQFEALSAVMLHLAIDIDDVSRHH
jgi:hypothetical protein